ncbi:MAG: DUF1844 domain-containing protein [Pirellulaceae bacterium]|nr:DUF1844 domain-containing protein [Pirellulaceae bacterium]
MPDKPAEEPKLIIDEDWKTQVQREKEELKQKLAESDPDAATAQPDGDEFESSADKPTGAADTTNEPVAATTTKAASSSSEKLGAPPPASLMLLVTTLATQAMGAMGLMPDEQGEKLPVNLEFARHFIDMLSVLEEKTTGNLSDDEKVYLTDALHQLRMAFVAVSKNPPAAKQT